MGGYGAIHTALAYPERFSACIALSSALVMKEVSVDYGDDQGDRTLPYGMVKDIFGDPDKVLDSDENPEVQYKGLKKDGADIPRLYMAIGTDDDLLQVNRDFVKFLDEEGADYTYEEGQGKHDWFFWNEYLERGLKEVL